jgi:hypothetical protein
LAEAKSAHLAEPLILDVAPVKIKVGGRGDMSLALRRSGRVL